MGYLSQHIRNIKRKTTIQAERLESVPFMKLDIEVNQTKTRYLVLL